MRQYVRWEIREKEGPLAEVVTTLGACQVRSGTDDPCLEPAAVEILGVPFCERCAREQEAYFAIGQLARPHTAETADEWWWASDRRDLSLTEALRRVRRGLRRGAAEAAGALVGSSTRR